mgnify:CR=1 FL=1
MDKILIIDDDVQLTDLLSEFLLRCIRKRIRYEFA